MTTIINHDIRSVNGKYLVMPPYKGGQSGWGNLALPNVQAVGGDTAQQYPVNTKFVDFDRTHIYGYCYSRYTDPKANCGMFNLNRREAVAIGEVALAVGDSLIGVDGLDVETAATANMFAGGYFMPRINPYSVYRVVSNTAYNGGRVATEMDITIENTIIIATAADTDNCWLDKNPYTNLSQEWGSGALNTASVMGVTLINPVPSTYQWIQTWGPCYVPGGETLGDGDLLRRAWWANDGSVYAGSENDLSTSVQRQDAGYVIGNTTDGSGGWDPTWFINLQMER